MEQQNSIPTPTQPTTQPTTQPAPLSIVDFGPLTPPTITEVSIGQAAVRVSRTIPYEQVLEAINWCMNLIIDDRSYISAPLRRIVTDIAILKFWANFGTSDLVRPGFQLTTFYEWYDVICQHSAVDQVKAAIAPTQLGFFLTTLEETLNSIITYKNSAVGIVDAMREYAERQPVPDMEEIKRLLAADA